MIKELLKVWIVKLAGRVVGGLFSSTFCCSISHRIAQSVREGIHSSCKKLNTQSSNLIKCRDPRGSKCEIRGHTMGAKRSLDNNASQLKMQLSQTRQSHFYLVNSPAKIDPCKAEWKSSFNRLCKLISGIFPGRWILVCLENAKKWRAHRKSHCVNFIF